jgi:hypothetical protein
MHRTLFGVIVVALLGFGLTAGAQASDTAVASVASQAAATEVELRDLIKTLNRTARAKS